jgi:putative serine protease PepD
VKRAFLGTVSALAATAALVSGCGGSGSGSGNTTTAATPAQGGAVQLQQRFVKVVDSVSKSVVQIETNRGLGSGIIFDGKGDIVTNNHVVTGAKKVRVTFPDGTTSPGSVVGTFPAGDLAVVRASSARGNPAGFGDSSKLNVGDFVLAVGNPLGFRSSVTQGIVSSLGRTVSEPGGVTLPSAIQTSAAINPGNSGGALVDLAGQVVGIPTLAALDPELGGSAAPGIGFAIPSNTVKNIAQQIVGNGHVVASHRAYLGVQVATVGSGGGALVAGVQKGGPAAKAGIKPGELIVSVGGRQTPTAGALSAAIATKKPGDKVQLTLRTQAGGKKTVTVTLGQLPGGAG